MSLDMAAERHPGYRPSSPMITQSNFNQHYTEIWRIKNLANNGNYLLAQLQSLTNLSAVESIDINSTLVELSPQVSLPSNSPIAF